ncbi:MAG: hypothetical protein ACYTXC_14550 [Nostoc sp.]
MQTIFGKYCTPEVPTYRRWGLKHISVINVVIAIALMPSMIWNFAPARVNPSVK